MLLFCRTWSEPVRNSIRRTPARALAGGFALAVLALGGCAQSPQQLTAAHHPKEYFPASVYGPASRRVIPDGQPIPPGGGQYLVGKPYTIAGQTYYPSERKITQVGLASWYGDAFHGRLTANGEIYDRDGFTAAHPTMPLPSYARVTNLRNGYSMIVRVNDRGPYHSNRIMDVSRRVAEALDFQRGGTSKVKVEYVGRASLAGSDNTKLYATLRTDGPARLQGVEPATAVAEAAPVPAHVASLAPYAPTPAYRRRDIAEAFPIHEHEPARARQTVQREDRALPEKTHEAAIAVEPHSGAKSVFMPGRHEREERAAAPTRSETRVERSAAHRDVLAEARRVIELGPTPRPGRALVADMRSGKPKTARAPGRETRDILLPPSRPTRLAATPLHRHVAVSPRGMRSRDD